MAEQTQKTDEQLMVLYQMGHFDAFESLYQRHRSKIYGHLMNKIGDKSVVDELFQEIFIKLHRFKSKYDPNYPFLPWIFTILRNTCTDYFRKMGRASFDSDYDVETVETPTPENLEARVEEIPAFHALPHKQQEAIKLRFNEDLPFEEISKRLKTSPVNARQLVSRGIKQLKAILHKGEQQ